MSACPWCSCMVTSPLSHAMATFLCCMAQPGSGFHGAARTGKDLSPAVSACRALKRSREEGCSEPTTSPNNPRAITLVGASFGSLGTGTSITLWESDRLHTLTCISSMESPHMYIDTQQLKFALHPTQNKAALTPGAPRFTPHAQRASCPPPPLSTPQPGCARAHLLLDSPVCLPKVFAAGGTCFDTISSTKEAAHLV